MTSEIRKLTLKYIKNVDSIDESTTLNFNISISGNSNDQLFFSEKLHEIIEELTKEDYISKSEFNLRQSEIKESLKKIRRPFKQSNKSMKNGKLMEPRL
jgi:hypothetical protein